MIFLFIIILILSSTGLVCCDEDTETLCVPQYACKEKSINKNQTCINNDYGETTINCNLRNVDDTKIVNLPNCGISGTNRIGNGMKTRLFQYPWMVLLGYKVQKHIIYGCSGTLINSRYVLTAAHCISPKLSVIRLGEHDLANDIDCDDYCADPPVDVDIEKIFKRTDYNTTGDRFNDITLIKLARTINFTESIESICLPTRRTVKGIHVSQYVITGWGLTEKNSRSDILLQALVPFVDSNTCRRALNVKISYSQICAGGRSSDACAGDSGGALQNYGNNAQMVQFGLISYGQRNCAKYNVPTVYTNIASYMDWIRETIKNN